MNNEIQKMIEKLMALGNSEKRAKEIITEAESSSNREYVYNYYGVNNI